MHDDLDVLVVNIHALGTVHGVHFLHNVHLGGARAEDAQDLLRIDGAFDQLGAGFDMIAVLDQHRGATGHRVDDRFDGFVVRLQHDLTAALGVFHLDHACELRDRSLALRGTSFEKLGNTRETLGDIGCGSDAAGVEGTQRQLCTRLADGLCRYDANGLTDVHQLVGGQRPAIALGAHTALGVAGEHGTGLDFFHIVSDEIVEHVHGQCVASLVQHGFAVGRIDHVSCKQTGIRTTVGSLDKMQVALSVTLADLHRQAALGAAILFAHNHVLGDVHQTTGQVTRLCGTQCGIGQALTRAVLGDEVFQHGQAVAVVGLHRSRNDLALRVGHEASHACDLVNLHHVSSCT